MQSVTQLALYEASEDEQEQLCHKWHEVTQVQSHTRGFLSAQLYEADTDLQAYLRAQIPGLHWVTERFRFVSISQWASLSDYKSALHWLAQRAEGTLRASYAAHYSLLGTVAPVAFSLAPQVSSQHEFAFIVPFEVPADQAQEMRRQFSAVVEGMSRSFGGQSVPGSLGPGLYELDTDTEARLALDSQALGQVTNTKFRFINIARWSSPRHYVQVMRARNDVKPITFTGHGAYYRQVAEYQPVRSALPSF
jgi:heme-degrading monooxygenase HmoA